MSILSNSLGVASIFFCETEESVNGFLVVFMLLDLNNHLLQAEDSLVATLVGNFVFEITLSSLLVVLCLLLVFVRNGIGDTLFGRFPTSRSTSRLVDIATRSIVGMFISCTTGSFTGIRLAASAFRCIASNTNGMFLSLLLTRL